jgi:pimeloyl-ACP methyl ester carboxylesterase
MRKKTNQLAFTIIALIISINNFSFGQRDFINVNGCKIEIFTAGLENNKQDKLVIVFENGMASKLDNWKTVIDEVSKTSAIFSYNRPRIGESENDSLPPTTKHIVDNLRIMLLEKELKPPYLLVSHSFGGAYIRSFASYYPDEIAGLIFVDPIDFTKKKGDGDLPYLEIGLTQHQIDSMFAKPYDNFKEKLYAEMPNFYVEEVKISGQLTKTEFKECDSTPLPDVPVHFIMAGGYPTTPDDRGETIFDKKKLFRIDNNLKMKRWIKLLEPLQYGKFFYCSNSGHFVMKDDPETVISSIKLALIDYDRIQKGKAVTN